MSLKGQILDDVKTAMKAAEKDRLKVLRLITAAIKQVLGKLAYEVPVSSTKSMTGHLMAAAGALESVFCILAVRDNLVPPTINLEHLDRECDLDYVPNRARRVEVKHALNNSFGFGGVNAVLVFSRFGT